MIGLVVEGGASRTYFSAGVIDAIMEENIGIDYIVGASAGISTAMNYASNQKGRALEIAQKYVAKKEYSHWTHLLNRHNKSFYNLDYVFDKVPNELCPYDYEALKNFKGLAEAVVTNIHTGKPEYMPVTADDKKWKVLLASCSLPLMFPPVEIGGNTYMDGGISDSIPFMRAIDQGCDKLIVILSRERSYRKTKDAETRLASKFYKKYPNFVKALLGRNEMYNLERETLFTLEKQGRVLLIEPQDTTKWSRTTSDKQTLQAMYDEGYSKVQNSMEQIKKYLEQ